MDTSKPPKLDICLCTHNPDPHLIKRVLGAIAGQDADPERLFLTVVDNASTPRLDSSILDMVRERGIECQLIREGRLGVVHARARAIRETGNDLILFVDDDNELAPNYARIALRIAEDDPGIGCFGGKLSLPPDVVSPERLNGFIRYLAVRDDGDLPITRLTPEWGPWEPPGAGAVVRRDLATLYRERVDSDPRVVELGRRGKYRLSCGEDNLMMRAASQLGLKASYQPDLVLTHHINPARFKLQYLLRLLYWYGRSEVLLSHLLGAKLYRPWKRENLLNSLRDLVAQGPTLVNLLCDAAINLGKWVEDRRSKAVSHAMLAAANPKTVHVAEE